VGDLEGWSSGSAGSHPTNINSNQKDIVRATIDEGRTGIIVVGSLLLVLVDTIDVMDSVTRPMSASCSNGARANQQRQTQEERGEENTRNLMERELLSTLWQGVHLLCSEAIAD